MSAPLAPERLAPVAPDAASCDALVSLVEARREELDGVLRTRGALLVRGFELTEPAQLATIVEALGGTPMDYVAGNSPRTKIDRSVYSSTEYPARYPICLHSELSYAPSWPSQILFLCLVPPAEGGETPIADCRRMLSALPGDVRDRFEARSIRYVQNLHGGTGLGKSWMETFETSERAQVERFLAAGGASFEWRANGSLRLQYVRPATAVHQSTGEAVWFNQADQWHVSNLDARTREALLQVYAKDELPLNAYWDDGSDIAEHDLDVVRDTFRSQAVSAPWQRGDLLILDNMLFAHGRNPYRGPRKVVVAMSG